MQHFLTTMDWSRDQLQNLLDHARRFRDRPHQPDVLAGRTIALLFFNPSLRTRSSFEIGAYQLGAHAVVLQPGAGAWPIEFEDNVVMDGQAEEHVSEVARVLSRYCDLIAVRAFPKFKDWFVDREDRVINQFARYATVPVINMETITHPCQELALILALQDHFGGQLDGKNFVLTWTYHPKPLNTAVANSALIIAAKFGMNVKLLCPAPEYELDYRYMNEAKAQTKANGRAFEMMHDIQSAYTGADVVYAKSWGALPFFGKWDDEKPVRESSRHFMVDEAKMAMTSSGVFSHCLPLRRNVKATDAVMDSPACLAVEEAENRLHVQKALMAHLAGAQ